MVLPESKLVIFGTNNPEYTLDYSGNQEHNTIAVTSRYIVFNLGLHSAG